MTDKFPVLVFVSCELFCCQSSKGARCVLCANQLGCMAERVEEQKRDMVKNIGMEQHQFKLINEWNVSFHIDQARVIGDEKTLHDCDKIKELKPMPWLKIQESTIEGENLGCFAMRHSKKGAFIGLHMGGEHGEEECSVKAFGQKSSCATLSLIIRP